MNPLAVFAIALGGALGAVSRWRLDLLARRAVTALAARHRLHGHRDSDDPVRRPAALPLLGIGIVNILGSLLLGAAIHALDPGAELARALIVTGFLGGFTTFSTAVMDCWNLWRTGRRGPALALLLGVWALSLAALSLGAALAGALVRP